MKQALSTLVFLLTGTLYADAASILWGLSTPYTGSTAALTSTEYAVTSGSKPNSAINKLLFGTPYSECYWIDNFSQASNFILDARGGGSSTGFADGSYFTGNNGFVWAFFGAASINNACANPGQSCARLKFVTDKNWYLNCRTFDGRTAYTYVDGILRDQNTQTTGSLYTPTMNHWELFNGSLTSGSVRGMYVWSAVEPANIFGTAYQRGNQGIRPTDAPLTTNLAPHWPFDNCNTSGCADSVVSLAAAVYDTRLTVAITAPTNGATGLMGSIPLQATCSDAINCTSLKWYVDGSFVGSSTTSPYTVTWASNTFIDGSHTISAQALNAGGALSSVTSITASTSNSVSAKTVYWDPDAGNDANTCLSTGSPCQTLAGVQAIINANPLHGGDSILEKAGGNLNIGSITPATTLYLCGPSSVSRGSQCASQNTYPGATITVGTYGGSGNCHVLSAVTTDCGSVRLNASGGVTFWTGMINAVNVPNVTIQNMRFFGSQTSAQTCVFNTSGCANAITISTVGGYTNGSLSGSNITIQNVETTDFEIPIWAGNVGSGNSVGSGLLCGITIQDNYVHGSSISSQIDNAILAYGMNCGQGGNTGGSVISNYVNNVGGITGNHDGSGIQLANGNVNIVDNFNVTTNISYNDHECGGGYGNWWYQSKAINGGNNIVKGNESALVFPSIASGCDHGSFDLDLGTSGFVLNFNYGHETYGPSVNTLIGSVRGYSAGNNVIAYNIFENGDSLVTNRNGDMLGIAAATGYQHIYNNNIWNGYNGTIVPPAAVATLQAGLGFGNCPPSTSVLANNITVANQGTAATAAMAYGNDPAFLAACSTIKILANDWYPLSGPPGWRSIVTNLDTISSVSAWNSAVGATDQQTNPNFARSGGGATMCYTALSGIPVQPNTIRCRSAYELNNNMLIGAGTDLTQAPYSLTLPAQDYFTNTIPNGVGTGYNVGAGGSHN
jgi:hypothetical protein